jgi:hypothetical protein
MVRRISLGQSRRERRARLSVGFVENMDTSRRIVGRDNKPPKKTLQKRRNKKMKPKQVQQQV